MHEDIGKGKNRVLQAGRKPYRKQFKAFYPLDFKGAERKMKLVFTANQKNHNEDCRNVLGNHRGKSDSPHAHTKGNDEKQIQNHIENAGQKQEVKGLFGVAGRRENAVSQIVDSAGRHGKHVNLKVENRVVKKVGLCVHGGKNWSGKNNACQKQNYAGGKAENGRRVDSLREGFFVFRTDVVGTNRVHAASQAHQKPHEKKKQLGS